MRFFKRSFNFINTQLGIQKDRPLSHKIYGRSLWQSLKKDKTAGLCLFFIVIVFMAAILGPILSKYAYWEQIAGEEGMGPSFRHPMGTDALGRDMLVRILFGLRISLSVGIVTCLINLTIGVIYGGIAGYYGKRADSIMMRIVDIVYSLPLMLYVILFTVVLKERLSTLFELPLLSVFKTNGAGLFSIYLSLGLTYWMDMARIVRGQILSLKEREFVMAERVLGASNLRILFKHLIPNCIGPIMVAITMQIPIAVYTEALLSFVGLGVDPPAASLGTLAADGVKEMRSSFYLFLFPIAAISIMMLAFNLLGDRLRNIMDPNHLRFKEIN
ncbi:MAG: ABC transporter permease [Clostridia bacterium]|nr:ABC transporter permease [Clostridia bacterium]